MPGGASPATTTWRSDRHSLVILRASSTKSKSPARSGITYATASVSST